MYKLTFSWEFVRKLLLLFLYILKCTTFTSFNAEYTIKWCNPKNNRIALKVITEFHFFAVYTKKCWYAALTILYFILQDRQLGDIYVLPKWLAGLFIAGITIPLLIIGHVYLKRSGFTKEEFIRCMGIIVILQAAWGWCKLFVIKDSIVMVGAFENPAGFASCLVIGLPFILNICGKKYWTIVSFAFIFISIILSQSRAGVFCCISMLLVCQCVDIKIALCPVHKVILLITFSVVFIWGLSHLKQGSSQGKSVYYWKMCRHNKRTPLGTRNQRLFYSLHEISGNLF